MQTFLPYEGFRQSAQALDYKRLGKQRVEALQIHNIVSGKRTTGGWVNHPAVKMWQGYENALAVYHNTMIDEWVDRGYNNNMPKLPVDNYLIPAWLGDERLHSSHRANLLRKDADFYSTKGWQESPDIEYFWPTGLNVCNHGVNMKDKCEKCGREASFPTSR